MRTGGGAGSRRIEFRASDGTAVRGAREPPDTRVVWHGLHKGFLTQEISDDVFCTVSLVATATPLRPGVPAAAALPRRLPPPPGGARGPLRPLDADRLQQRRRRQPDRHTALGSGPRP